MKKFIILLERDKDRVDHVNKIRTRFPDIQVFGAIDGQTNKIEEILNTKEFLLSDDYKNKCNRGQLGCLFSHIFLWKKIVAENIKECVIFEDDVEIPNDFHERFLNIHKELPQNYDFLYLFVHPKQYKVLTEKDAAFIKGNKYISKAYKTYGTVGYCISLEGAKKLLKLFSKVTGNVDTQISTNLNKLNIFSVLKPFLSTIGQLESNDKNSKLKSNVWRTKKLQIV